MIRELAKKALELRSKGYTTEEIAEILNVHPDTVVYLLAGAISGKEIERKPAERKLDVFIDRSVISRSPSILSHIAEAMANYARELIDSGRMEEPDVIAGFNSDGFALALLIAKSMVKHVALLDLRGSVASIDPTFADIIDKKVLIVDDIVSSGALISRAIDALRNVGGLPVGILVLINKSGKNDVSNVPIHSLFEVRIL